MKRSKSIVRESMKKIRSRRNKFGKFKNGAVTGAFSRMFNDLAHESREALKNPRAAKIYAGDGNYQYTTIAELNALELSGMGRALKWIARGLEVINISVQHGTRTYANGIEYDVFLEDRLVQRDANQAIVYESNVIGSTSAGKKLYEIPKDARYRQETDVRFCVFSGNYCTN